MKKTLLLTLLGIFVLSIHSKSFAAFPVEHEKNGEMKTSGETMKASIKLAKEELKNDFETAAPSAAAGGGEGKRVLAAVLAVLLGGLGVHDFVLGNWTKGFMHLGLFVLGLVLMVIGLSDYVSGSGAKLPTLALIGYLIWVGNGIWALVDFIRILIGKYPGL